MVEREYLARSRAAHPDYHGLASPEEQRASLELSAGLNEAYLALKDPYRRAEHLLALLSGPTAQQEKNQDQAFLFEMMELRERIDEAKVNGPESVELQAIRTELAERERDCESRIAGEFARLEQLPADGGKKATRLLNVRRALNEWMTIRSLVRDVDFD